MAKTNTVHASARMLRNNPMKRQEIRQKMSATLHANKHRPPVRGGNGTGATKAELAIAEAMGMQMQIIVPVGKGRGHGWPTHYKIDVGCAERKVAIEVDGASHAALSRQAQDAKKDAFLRGLGWIVLRVTNRQALTELESTISRLKALTPTSPTTP